MNKCRRGRGEDIVGCEVAFAHLHGMSLVAVFGRYEPEGFVFFDRSADGAAELFAREMRSRLVSNERRKSLQRLMPEVHESGTVVVVCARLGDYVDDAGAGAAHFGGEFVGRNLELLHAVLGEVHQGAAHHLVVVIRAVNVDVAAAPEGAGRRHLQGIGFRRVEIGSRPVAGNQKCQFQKVAAIQRYVFDGRGFHNALNLGLGRINLGLFGLYCHNLAHLGNRQLHIYGRGTSDLQANILDFGFGERRRLDAKRVIGG